MREWLGAGGKPVGAVEAQRRADQCFGCHFNVSGSALAGDVAKRHVEAKARLRLAVVDEELLHTCGLCRCYLPLKVHVPMLHIRRFQREAVREAIRAGKPTCWQLKDG